MISALTIKQKSSVFTIVELLIVVIVLVILATLVTVAYRGITSQADETVFKKNLTQASDQLELYRLSNKRYPTGVTTDEALEMAGVKQDGKMSYDFTSSGTKYCLSATLNGQTYNIQSNVGSVEQGN